jgi:hypothetical protein
LELLFKGGDMNKRNLGSKQAELLARKKFGDRAFVKRSGKVFMVGHKIRRIASLDLDMIDGMGHSWEAALRDAGVSIPVAAPYLPPTVQHMIGRDGMPDTDPCDTDAPVTMPEEG